MKRTSCKPMNRKYQAMCLMFWGMTIFTGIVAMMAVDAYWHSARFDIQINSVNWIFSNQKDRLGLYVVNADSMYGKPYGSLSKGSHWGYGLLYQSRKECLYWMSPIGRVPGVGMGVHYYNFLSDIPSDANPSTFFGSVATMVLVNHLTLIIPMTLITLMLGIYINRYRNKNSAGLCGQCGYDLQGLAANTACPECGHVNSDTVKPSV